MKNDWIGELTELAQKHQVNLLLLQFNNSKNDLDVVASGHNPIANELIDKLSTDKEMSSAPIKLIVESLQIQNKKITELKKTNKSGRKSGKSPIKKNQGKRPEIKQKLK